MSVIHLQIIYNKSFFRQIGTMSDYKHIVQLTSQCHSLYKSSRINTSTLQAHSVQLHLLM